MTRARLQGLHWPTVLAGAALLAMVFLLLRHAGGEFTVVKGNIHDFFLPLIAARAVAEGGLGHPGLHSPFGVLYFLLSYNSFEIISRFPATLSPDKIHFLSSAQWALVLVAFFAMFRALQDEGRKFPFWMLAVLLVVCFQAKDFDLPLTFMPDWYGTYNYHLWGLLLMQAANHYCWRGGKPGGGRAIGLALVEAAVLAVAFNYKVSFFVAAGVLCLLPLGYLGGRRSLVLYYATLIAASAAMMAAFAAMGASYPHYFQDLAQAAGAKTLATSPLIRHLAAALCYALVCSRFAVTRAASPAGWLRVRLERYVFDGIVGLSVLLGAMGDYRWSFWPYVLLGLWAVSCASQRDPAPEPAVAALRAHVKTVSAAWMAILVVSALTSFRMIADAAQGASPAGFSVAQSIGFSPRPLALQVMTTFPGAGDLEATGLFATSPGRTQAMLDYSYRDHPRYLAASLGFSAGTDYVQDVNAMAGLLRGLAGDHQGRLAIAHLGFANPWPLLTGNPLPEGSLHWVHLGTTVSARQLGLVLDPLKTADAVVVPLLSADWKGQPLLDCAFYRWNFEHGGLFVPQHAVGYNLLFVRRGGLLDPALEPPVRMDEGDIERQCRNVFARAETGEN